MAGMYGTALGMDDASSLVDSAAASASTASLSGVGDGSATSIGLGDGTAAAIVGEITGDSATAADVDSDTARDAVGVNIGGSVRVVESTRCSGLVERLGGG